MKTLYKGAVINARKFDGKIYKYWKADLIDQRDSCFLFHGVFDREIEHSELGVIRRNTISLEYFWLNENFNIFKFFEPDGSFRNFYCNVCLPPTFANGALDYVDLDIDVIVASDFSHKTLDNDEFEKNALDFGYSQELRQITDIGLKKIIDKIQSRDFPFDSTELIYEL